MARFVEKARKGEESMRKTAMAVAKRLVDKRPLFSGPKGPTAIDLMDYVDKLMADATKNGVYVTQKERRALALWHAAKRCGYAQAEIQERDAKSKALIQGTNSLDGGPEPEPAPHVG